MPENPFQPPREDPASSQDTAKPSNSTRAAYNVVTDTVTGVNVRWSDNKFQAIFVMVSVPLAAGVSSLLAIVNAAWEMPWFVGALIGAFVGLVLGILASGICLMFYRAGRHIRGKHD